MFGWWELAEGTEEEKALPEDRVGTANKGETREYTEHGLHEDRVFGPCGMPWAGTEPGLEPAAAQYLSRAPLLRGLAP